MIKSDDLVKRYQEDPSIHTLRCIWEDLVKEVREIANQRRGYSDAAVAAIFNEQDLKWRAFVRKSGDETIKLEGFEMMVSFTMPDTYESWKKQSIQNRPIQGGR